MNDPTKCAVCGTDLVPGRLLLCFSHWQLVDPYWRVKLLDAFDNGRGIDSEEYKAVARQILIEIDKAQAKEVW